MDTTQVTQNGSATRRRLERTTDDRVIAGVASGFAEYAGLSTGFVRLALIVLTLFGGAGIALYAAGWLLIPDQGEAESLAARFAGRLDTTEKRVGAVLMALAVVIVMGGASPGLVAAAALAAIGFALTRPDTNEEN